MKRHNTLVNFRLDDQGQPQLRRGNAVICAPLFQIQIEDHGTEVVASWPEVEAWGAGKTEAQALTVLQESLVALHADLSAQPDEQLGPLPRRWKQLLKGVLSCLEES